MNRQAVSEAMIPSDGKHPEEYEPDRFVNRANEQALILQKIERMGDPETGERFPLIELYGVIGIGKTWLAEQIRHCFRHDHLDGLKAELPKPTMAILIDLGSYPVTDQVYFLLQAMVRQIEDQEFPLNPDQRSVVALFASERSPATVRSRNKLADNFVNLIRELSDEAVPVLIFDTTEQADDRLLEWLEERIISPLARTDRVLLMFTGRRRLRWKKFAVRQRVEPLHIGAFDLTGTAEQLRKLGAENIAHAVHQYSSGHPQTNSAILDALEELREATDRPQIDDTLIKENEKEIWDIVDNLIIEHRFLGPLLQQEGGVDLVLLVRLVSVLRKFNANPLRIFALKFAGETFEARPGVFYLDAIRQMVDTTLVEWSSARGGYVLDPVIRRIMSEALRVSEKEEFVRRHREAKALYDEWQERYPDSSGSFLLERVFHFANILKGQGREPEIAEQVISFFEKALKQEMPLDIDIAEAVRNQLKEDSELRELVSEEAYSTMEQLVEGFVARATDQLNTVASSG